MNEKIETLAELKTEKDQLETDISELVKAFKARLPDDIKLTGLRHGEHRVFDERANMPRISERAFVSLSYQDK